MRLKIGRSQMESPTPCPYWRPKAASSLGKPNSSAVHEGNDKAQPNYQGLGDKIARQMKLRGWTNEQIQDAFENGEQVKAVNKATGGDATRYVNPTTGQSVVIDDTTGKIIQVGKAGFVFGPGSGDYPWETQ